MNSILSELGFAFNADEYARIYGNEKLLALYRRFTVRTVDRITKIPQITKLYNLVKTKDARFIELPRFAYRQLVSSTPSVRTPVGHIDRDLPKHKQIETMRYIGQSNPNQQIIVKHIIDNVFQPKKPAGGTTLKLYAGCHEMNTGILMFDGTTKLVQDIKVGEFLMGDDSTPREVLNLVRGNDTMYRIANARGDSYVVNGDHILSLTDGKSVSDISVNEYLALPKDVQKDLRGYKAKVEFPEVELPIDPYVIGLVLIRRKYILHMYKCNSRANRLRLLAGLLDSGFKFSQTIDCEQLIEDLVYVLRSLGIDCRKRKCDAAFGIQIEGNGFDEIDITQLESDDFYGFQVDGNQRYLMSDFIVTHNCGKSYAAMDIIGKMKLKTLIVVPNTYLLDQWMNLLAEYFPDSKIGTLYGKQKLDGDIIVGIINTVSDLKQFDVIEKKPWPNEGAKLKYMKVKSVVQVDDILKTVGLAIFDESHMYVSKEFRRVFKRLWARYTLGLSATPDIREDKLDIIHQMWLGPILDAETLEGFNASQDTFVSDANLVEYHALAEHCKYDIREDGMIDYSSIIGAIVADPNRNDIIVNEIVKLMELERCVMVFSDRRSHLESLYDLLHQKCMSMDACSQLEMPESEKKIILYGGSSEDTINKAKVFSTVVFTTYAYSSTGVSIIKMNALVLTTPRRTNMKQIINRVFRLGSDQTIRRIIVDIVDSKFPIKAQIRERIKAYNERGCRIVRTKEVATRSRHKIEDEPDEYRDGASNDPRGCDIQQL